MEDNLPTSKQTVYSCRMPLSIVLSTVGQRTAFPRSLMLHRCICHRFKAAQPKPVRKVNSLNCAVNSIHQPEGNLFLFFFYSPPFFPLFWCWATKAYISSPSFCPPKSLWCCTYRKKRGNLIPLVPNIYIQEGKAMGKYESYRYRPTVSFWSRLLSVISDGQTGGWGPCAAHSNRLYSVRYHPLRSQL